MKKIIANSMLILALFINSAVAEAAQRKSLSSKSEDPPLSLGVSHILPSALVIPSGVIVLGTTVGAGFFDVFDVSSNLYLDLVQVFNLSVKANIFKSDILAGAVFATIMPQTIRTNVTDPNTQIVSQVSKGITSIDPGFTLSYRLRRQLTGQAGVSTSFKSTPVDKSVLTQRTAYIHGTTLYKEFSYGFSPSFALSLGGSYDLTYEIWGAGVTFHTGGFEIGAHYYINVAEGSVLPIVGGGYSARLD